MGIAYNPKWNILTDVARFTPSYTPFILMHVESAGYESPSLAMYNQRVWIRGTEVLNSSAPRSYRATRLTYGGAGVGWQFNSSNGYDVYGSTTSASNLLTYLQSFSVGDILILNTWDEPLNNRTIFRDELVNNFKSSQQYSTFWETRCSYQLIAVKGKGVIYERVAPRYAESIKTTLWLG